MRSVIMREAFCESNLTREQARIEFDRITLNILDTPEILWHYPEYSDLYESFKTYLELRNRAELLNQRCDIIQEILNLLSTNITTKNSEKLEKTIIYLICFESFCFSRGARRQAARQRTQARPFRLEFNSKHLRPPAPIY
jgi:hypothetical protein